MVVHDTVEHGFKGMIKSSGHVKYFRHQCNTLIQISRHFWKFVAMMEARQYESFQKFVVAADQAIQSVAGFGPQVGKDAKDEDLQRNLDLAIVVLVDYWKDLSTLDNYDPETLMLEARTMDEKRKNKILSVEELKLKKIPIFKKSVDFYIHDGTNRPLLVPLKITPESTGEELLFKLGRNPASRIRLHENAFFYTRISWQGDGTSAEGLGLKSKTDLSFRTKKGLSDFGEYLKIKETEGPVHVFLDRNPSVHVLLTTREWSRLFSLVGLIDRGKVIVLKGVDGTLYHAQQVVEKFIQPNAKISEYSVYRLDVITNSRIRHQANLKAFDCLNALREARTGICSEEARLSEKSKWLIEIPSQALNKDPTFDGWGPKPKIHKRPGFALSSSSATGGTTTGSTQTTSQVSRTKLELDSAQNRVKAMVEKLENDRKEAEKKEKKKGFFGRIFS